MGSVHSLHPVEAPEATTRPVRVIATTGGKGGVGKTSVSVNLALAFAKLGQRVLLFDADLGLASIDTQLGLQPTCNISHVINGDCLLRDVVLNVSPQVSLIPSASGVTSMTHLSRAEQAGIIQAFNTLAADLDVLIVDNAPGISPSALQFASASQEVVVVVCDEPSSITDAYAVIKVLSRDYGVQRFQVLVNMTRSATEAHSVFTKIARVAARFLDVTLVPLGGVPYDGYLHRAVREQTAVVDRYPRAPSSVAFKRHAKTFLSRPVPSVPRGHVEFFIEQLVSNSGAAGPSP